MVYLVASDKKLIEKFLSVIWNSNFKRIFVFYAYPGIIQLMLACFYVLYASNKGVGQSNAIASSIL